MATPALSRLKFLFFILLSACATTTQVGPQVQVDSFEGLFPKNSAYIQKNCHFASILLEPLRSLPGIYCLLTPQAVVMANGDSIYAYDKNILNYMWQIKPFYAHHQLNLSEINDDILTMTSEYVLVPGAKAIRYDQLVVLNNGRIIKKFSFKKYLKKMKIVPDNWNNNWSTDGMAGKSVEKTHMNSFREIYKISNGKKILTGYLAHSTHQQHTYILDKSLKKVVRVLDFTGHRAHDVRQYNENELIFFLNENTKDPEPRQSKIETYNMLTGEFKVLYQSKKVTKVYPFCGTVQVLNDKRLFIHYSKCTAELKDGDQSSYFEIVDLTQRTSHVINATDWLGGNTAAIIDELPPEP